MIHDKDLFLRKLKGIPLRCCECKKDYKDSRNKLMIGHNRKCIKCQK
jgi:hypothetical protein